MKKKFKVWVELEKTIEAHSQAQAERLFIGSLNVEDLEINSEKL